METRAVQKRDVVARQAIKDGVAFKKGAANQVFVLAEEPLGVKTTHAQE